MSFNVVVFVIALVFFLCACSGESYAGIYVPTLVQTIMNMNPQQTADRQINLIGFAVSLTEWEATFFHILCVGAVATNFDECVFR